MLNAHLVILVCLLYVGMLFAVAFAGGLRASRDPAGWLASPLVYTLSISIYCTSWTFFGAVGAAATNGLEFVTIYLGPTIVFAGWWIFLRKLVTIGRIHHITSIADFISARFGKHSVLGALVTIVALVATAPYIALQLKALVDSFQVITSTVEETGGAAGGAATPYTNAFWMAAGLCVFSIVFGVRNIDVNERHHGVIAAIAVEAAVDFAALLAVGLWVVFSLAGTPALDFSNAPAALANPEATFGPRWITLCFLAGAAVICLPRQFHVTVVENSRESQLRTASWLFPLYMFLICLFVVPIAVAGLGSLPAGANPDLFVLTLPLHANQNALALLVFLGGFSSATSMVIVCSIALSTMISNHIVMPLALRFSLVPAGGRNVRRFILGARRASVVFVVFLGFVYFRLSGTSGALAAIGLISFCGIAQLLPVLVGGLYWRRGTHSGAVAGLAAGFPDLELHAVPAQLRRLASDAGERRRNRPVRLGAARAVCAVRSYRPRSAGACGVLEHVRQYCPVHRRVDAVGADAAGAHSIHAFHRRLPAPDRERIARHPAHRADFRAAPDRQPHSRPDRGDQADITRRGRIQRQNRQRRTDFGGRGTAGGQCRRRVGALAGVERRHQ